MNRRDFLKILGSASAACWWQADALHAGPMTPSGASLPIPDVWGDGQLLAFSGLDGPTDYRLGVVARTIREPAAIAFVLPATALIKLGDGAVKQVRLTGDTFEVTTAQGVVRGAFVDAWHVLLEGPSEVASMEAGLVMRQEGTKLLVGVGDRFAPSHLQRDVAALIAGRRSWFERQSAPNPLSDNRARTLAKAISGMKTQVCTPEGLLRHRWTTPDRWPHRDLWLWDSVFHAMGWRHLDMALAREMIEAVFDGQQTDGRIPHQLNPVRPSVITQPPVLALGVQQLHRLRSADGWMESLYPRLARYLEWDFTHRIPSGNGLAQWHIEGDPHSRSGESGMDNSPRFDAAVGIDAVDFNSFLSLECSVMADFARELGRTTDAQQWLDRHHELNRLINERLWDPDAGFYFDYDPSKKQRSTIQAVSGFFPLLCGAANVHQVAALAAQLKNPRTFGTRVPLPSAVNAEGMVDPDDMWRGPMWVNTNWLTALGFERGGMNDLAKQIRSTTLAEIERWYVELGTLCEFYDVRGVTAPDRLPRKGKLDPHSPYHQAIHDYGWTMTLYTDLVFTTS